MSQFLIWTEDELGVGVHDMDKEHQGLIARMNKVYDVKDSTNAAEVESAVQDLLGFTLQHFKDEEALMEQQKYERLDTHKIIHQKLITDLGKYVEEYKSTGKLSEAFFDFLKFWLSAHIQGIDRQYGHVFGTLKKAA